PLLLMMCVSFLSRGCLSRSWRTTTSGGRDTRRPPPRQASAERRPVDGVERDAHRERRRLNERACGVRHAERKNELVELRQEESSDRGRDKIAATAEQRSTPEHDGCDGREKVVVALVGRRLV